MKNFQGLIKEVNRTLTEIILFEVVIDTTLVFLFFYFMFAMFDIIAWYAAIPAALCFLLFYIHRARFSKSKWVESKYAPLREKLRTASDHMKEDNPVVEELKYEVTREMKNVGLSMFIKTRSISLKVFMVIVFSFLIIFTTIADVKFIDFVQRTPDIFERKGPKGVGDFVATELNQSDDIFGEEDVAILGDEELQIKIKPVDFKVSVKEVGDLETRQFESLYPKEVNVKESNAFEENIAVEDQELVRNYFNKLAEG